MSLIPAANENPAAIRAVLLSRLTSTLGPLFNSGELRGQLSAWLAPLDTAQIAHCLCGTPEETCDRLADALLRQVALDDPEAAVRDLIADAFQRIGTADRARLAEFVSAVRETARLNDGVVEDRHLLAAGFGAVEARRLMPHARRIIERLDNRGSAARFREDRSEGTPAERLIEAGTRAGLRHDPHAMALAS